jgi:hypothetical protein
LKIRIALVAAMLAVASAFVGTSTAGAANSSIKVTTKFEIVNFCRPVPETLNFRFYFKAKIKRKNTGLPKRVTVTYTVTDDTLGQQVLSDKVVLKPRSFEGVGAVMGYAAGHALTYKLKSVYRAPNTHKLVKATTTVTDTVPDQAALDAASPPIPACDPAGDPVV